MSHTAKTERAERPRRRGSRESTKLPVEGESSSSWPGNSQHATTLTLKLLQNLVRILSISRVPRHHMLFIATELKESHMSTAWWLSTQGQVYLNLRSVTCL